MKKVKASDINFVEYDRAKLIQFYRLSTITRKLDVSNSSVYLWEKIGAFPKSVDFTDTCKAWVASEVEEWALARVENRNAKVALRNATQAANDEKVG